MPDIRLYFRSRKEPVFIGCDPPEFRDRIVVKDGTITLPEITSLDPEALWKRFEYKLFFVDQLL